MIVTIGKHVRIDACSNRLHLSRTAEATGVVRVEDHDGVSILLPANDGEAADFISAYLCAIEADVPYRETDVPRTRSLTELRGKR